MARRSITRLLPWLTALLGLALTLAAWRAARVREERVLAARFQAEAEQVQRAVGWELALFSEVLQSLGPLHALSDRVTAYDFDEFARKGMSHQYAVLGPFGFAQWIPAALRAAVEGPSADGTPGLLLVETEAPGRIRRAGERAHYFPLTYQYPTNGLGLPLGFDLASLPEAPAVLARLVDGRTPVLGPRTRDLIPRPAGEGADGFLVFAPILDEDGSVSGFTVAILWPQELLRRALDRTLVRGLQVTLFDPAGGAPPREESGLAQDAAIRLVDQPWVLRCETVPGFLDAHATPLPWLALGSGLLVTLLLTGQTTGLVRRAARIERTVRERTAELQEANRKLGDEMQERARLEIEIEEVAEREKRRIGHDLHDSLGQKLTGAVYLSKALAGSLGPETGEARDSAEKINEILKDAVAEVRRTARGLAPVEVGAQGLAAALHRLADDTCSVYGLACSFEASGEPGVGDARMAAQLYHIAQEAVTNAIRHGGAREVVIRLEPHRLEVRDNGRGFDPAQPAGSGAGLRIMRHRAASFGGALEVQGRPGGGAAVICRF